MPNLVAPITQAVLAQFPGATVHARGQDFIDHAVGGNRHIFTQVGGHLHYDDAGTWQEINTDFVNSSRSGYTDNNSTSRFLCDVDGNTGRYVIPRRERIGEYFTLGRPQYWTGAQWRNLNLPGRVRSGQQLSWSGANISFTLSHSGRGMKYDVTLNNATNATNIRWALALVGLTFNNWQLISQATGQVVAQLHVPTMTDANGVEREVAATYSGGYITFTPDYSGLTYPIVIDPTYTDGYGGDVNTAVDTAVASGAPTFNNGVNILLGANTTTKFLMRFNLSAIASTATCNSATLHIFHNGAGAAQAWTVTLYSIASGNTAWIEGTKSSAQAGAGEPCWDALAANGSGGVTTAWAGSAGLETSGTDYEASSIGSFSGDRADAADVEYTSALNTTRTKGWFGSPNTNYGIVSDKPQPTGSFRSAEAANTAVRPKLVVDYTAASNIVPILMHQRRQRGFD